MINHTMLWKSRKDCKSGKFEPCTSMCFGLQKGKKNGILLLFGVNTAFSCNGNELIGHFQQLYLLCESGDI